MKKIKFEVLTLFPELVKSYLNDALLAKALREKLFEVNVTDLRKFSQKKYNSIDDTIFGGGDGMLFQYEPLKEALKSLGTNQKEKSDQKTKVVYLSPQGKPWTHDLAQSWAQDEKSCNIILLCGRYAGIDQRFISEYVDEEISIGDFVLSGGELGALVLIESISRFIPGVLGDQVSASRDSFEDGLLEAPQFTKPQTVDDLQVPQILLSGNHQKISEWRLMCSILMTKKKRPDLLRSYKKPIDWKKVRAFYDSLSATDRSVLGLEDVSWEDPHEA